MNADRFIDDHGREITKKDYTESGTDTYGDPTYTEATTTVQAVYELSNSGAINTDETGVRLTNVADVYLPSTVSVDGPNEQRQSVFVLSNTEYKVVRKDVQQDLIHCHCEQKNI